jgi:hypothetical protein
MAAHEADIAALGIVKQSRIWRLEPSGIYIIKINATANLMPSRRSIPQNTILINSHASPSSNRISWSLRGAWVQRRNEITNVFHRQCVIFGFFFPTNSD